MEQNELPPQSQQYNQSSDPYAPPSVQVAAPVYAVGPQAELAGRGTRLGAQILNGLTVIPGAGLGGAGFAQMDQGTGQMPPLGMVCIALGVVYLIALLVINLRLLARQGQSLGKMWAKVRIVRTDGSPVSLARLIGLRYIINAVIGALPFVGSFYSLADILFIFRQDRRCIHDLIADTKVVVA